MGTGTPAAAAPSAMDFDAFYRAHRARLVGAVAAAMRCDVDLATDAVDEAFVRALVRWPKVARMDAPAGWVFTVARNHLRRGHARRAREADLSARVVGSGSGVDTPADHELWLAVGALPERERLAVALRYLADLTERQVAEVMGIAPGTVAATLHSARRRLADALDARSEVTP